jgi:ubiquinone/menaquinone biosynthesis C-methylase UbiE
MEMNKTLFKAFDLASESFHSKFLRHQRLKRLTKARNLDNQIKVNIGCGDGWVREGWLGMDYRARRMVYAKKEGAPRGYDIDWNVLWGLPFENETVEAIYMSHVLEHFTYNESCFVTAECARVLRRGGRMRVVVPDLDLYVTKFVEGDLSFFKNPRIAGGYWLGNLTDTFLMNFYSTPLYNNNCHKYSYNFENLSYRLRQQGFGRIDRSAYVASRWPEFNHSDFDSSNQDVPAFSLYVDAEK